MVLSIMSFARVSHIRCSKCFLILRCQMNTSKSISKYFTVYILLILGTTIFQNNIFLYLNVKIFSLNTKLAYYKLNKNIVSYYSSINILTCLMINVLVNVLISFFLQFSIPIKIPINSRVMSYCYL